MTNIMMKHERIERQREEESRACMHEDQIDKSIVQLPIYGKEYLYECTSMNRAHGHTDSLNEEKKTCLQGTDHKDLVTRVGSEPARTCQAKRYGR